MKSKASQTLSTIEIESLFDSEDLEKIRDEQWTSPLQKDFFLAFNDSDFPNALNICEDIFQNNTEILLKVFALQWAIAITEKVYNLELRQKWFSRWSLISEWTTHFWCRYLYHDQQALHYYFQGSLGEAQKVFEQNLKEAETEQYERGQMRTLFHLGLISKCQNNNEKSISLMNKSLMIARKNRAIRFIERIEEQLLQLQNYTSAFENRFDQVEQYLLKNNLKAARKLTLFICKQRRYEKRSWEANSEYILLALVLYSFKQMKRFQLVLNRIKDPVIKKHILHSANRIALLSENLMIEYKMLCDILNINHSIELHKEEVVYHGINFGSPKLSDTAALVKALALNPQGLDKESLCKIIWNSENYDPTYHDQKIYRIISKVRKLLGRTEVISNHYNFYKISPL